MEEIQFTRNSQNMHSFGKFLVGNPTRPVMPVAAGFRLKPWTRACFWRRRALCKTLKSTKSSLSSSLLNSFIFAKFQKIEDMARKLVVMANSFWPCSAATFVDTQVHVQT